MDLHEDVYNWEIWFVERGWPSPKGLLMGLGSVLVAQIIVLLYYIARKIVLKSSTIRVSPPPPTTLAEDLRAHVTAPESFFMVFGYLCAVWMFKLLPDSYYDLTAGVNWLHVLYQFLVVDFWTYVDHLIEHNWPALYKISHKAHHKWINPKLYNAFNGSILDTLSLILIPLFLTHQICRFVNTWSFIAFGTLYASQFTLIHCEFPHPWDGLFEMLGIGTAADHNVHHMLFIYNYGHFFMYFDKLFGTYKSPHSVKRMQW